MRGCIDAMKSSEVGRFAGAREMRKPSDCEADVRG
jgi:hypothetical protein